MKLLIRTITFAAICVFMTIIILNSTIVETTKQEIDAATKTALYRTINAYVKNREIVMENLDENTYFNTDNDFFLFYYDSLLVQLNGKLSVDVYCNDVDLDTGVLDIDTTVTYRGLDGQKRTYTVHADTKGKIPEYIRKNAYLDSIYKELSLVDIGTKFEWAGHRWVLVENQTNSLILLLDEHVSSVVPHGDVDYKTSELKVAIDNSTYLLEEEFRNKLTDYTLDNFNTLSGVYINGGSDNYVGRFFPLSLNQATKLMNSGYQPSAAFWLRTICSSNSGYIYGTNGQVSSFNLTGTAEARPAIRLIKAKVQKLNVYDDEGDKVYLLDLEPQEEEIIEEEESPTITVDGIEITSEE